MRPGKTKLGILTGTAASVVFPRLTEMRCRIDKFYSAANTLGVDRSRAEEILNEQVERTGLFLEEAFAEAVRRLHSE